MSYFRRIPHLLSPIFEYETAKVVVINSKKVSIIYRVIQLLVVCYIIGYVLLYEKGYQSFEDVEGATMSKVKGVTVTNYSSSEFSFPDTATLYNRIWDPAEYVVPHAVNDEFFIMTNVVITPNQTQSICDEDPDAVGALCDDDHPCPVGEKFLLGSGTTTGRCIPSTQKPGVTVCEVKAWCPVERDVLPLKGNRVLINGAEEYTVLIKSSIAFPPFGPRYRRNNILDTSNSTYLTSCRFDANTDPFCPVFRIGSIIAAAGEKFEDMGYKGGIISITIKWDCDLDWNFMKYCKPEYSFYRLDDKHSELSPGLNFRFPVYEGYEKRTLLKAYGIKFVIQTIGKGGKFDLIPTMLNIGAGSGLMVLGPFICDYISLRFTKSKERYRSSKIEYIEGEDAFRVNREEYQPIT